MHVGRHGEDHAMKFKVSIRMENKGDFSDFEGGMVVGLSVSGTAALLGFSHTLRFPGNGLKNRSYPVRAALWEKIPCWCQRSEENGQTASS